MMTATRDQQTVAADVRSAAVEDSQQLAHKLVERHPDGCYDARWVAEAEHAGDLSVLALAARR